jgi:hypothetical protein
MPDYNPDFPEVLGNQWLMSRGQNSRVWAGAPARMQRLVSTTAETITALKLSANVNPQARASVPTLIDVITEGNETTAIPKLARMAPNADGPNGGWAKFTGATTNLWQNINADASRWPSTAAGDLWIRTMTPTTEYRCSVDASLFHTGGAAVNGRVFWVAVEAILGANTGFRKMSITMDIGGTIYHPAGDATRNVHGYGSIHGFWWGEINPATQRPWTPADIADFRPGGTSFIRLRSGLAATTANHPRAYAVALNVQYLETENRVAVGVWRRPEDIGNQRLITVTTDTLRTLPAGTADWSKPSGVNHLYYWRQTVSPSEYGPTVADDVRWNGAYQDLGPAGEPPGTVFPLHHHGIGVAPSDVPASFLVTHDAFGRPSKPFSANSRAAYGLALLRSDAADSVDSQPYRLDLEDVVPFRSGTGTTGQRFTPASSQSYLGFRLPVFPASTGPSTLTIRIHRVSDGVQVGGEFSITLTEARKIPKGSDGLRYLTGFLSSGAALVGGTQYEVRLTHTGSFDWYVLAPDASLAPTRSFGGTTDGAVIAGAHVTTRDMSINLIRQPDPPTNLVAAIVDVPVTTYAVAEAPTVQHVGVSWTLPASGMGALFARYELERRLDGGDWHRLANLNTAATASLPDDDHEVPRDTEVEYRIRAVGRDGRISIWTESNAVTPETNGLLVILTSNHDPSLEVAYFYDTESTYPILSAEGDETLRIHGADRQVVFMESEDRGIGWRTEITINQITLTGKGGQHVLTPLLNLIRSLEIPYVCLLDNQGTQVLGHLTTPEVPQSQPAHRYKAAIEATPTHALPVPVEVP